MKARIIDIGPQDAFNSKHGGLSRIGEIIVADPAELLLRDDGEWLHGWATMSGRPVYFRQIKLEYLPDRMELADKIVSFLIVAVVVGSIIASLVASYYG